MGILKLFFIVSLISLTAGELIRFQSGSGVNITFNNIAVGILILLWILIAKNKKLIRRNYLVKPALAFIIICVLSLLMNMKILNFSNFIVSFLYLLRLVIYISLSFVVLSFEGSFKKKIPLYMILSSMLIVIFGFIQFIFYPSLRNLINLEWDEHMRRMFSTFFDPNFLGIFLVLNLLLISGLFMHFYKNKNRLKITFLSIAGLLTFVGIFITYSRSALLALCAGSIIFLTMYGKKKMILAFLTIIFLSVYLFYTVNKSDTTTIFRDISSEARIGSTLSTLPIIKDNLLIGVGFNAYRYAQLRYGILKLDARWEASHAGAGTDNSFLFILATTGIVGLISFLYLWEKIVKKQFEVYNHCRAELISASQKIKKEIPNPPQGISHSMAAQVRDDIGFRKMISAVTVSSIGGVFVSSLFINSLFYPLIMYWLWILVGLNDDFKGNR